MHSFLAQWEDTFPLQQQTTSRITFGMRWVYFLLSFLFFVNKKCCLIWCQRIELYLYLMWGVEEESNNQRNIEHCTLTNGNHRTYLLSVSTSKGSKCHSGLYSNGCWITIRITAISTRYVNMFHRFHKQYGRMHFDRNNNKQAVKTCLTRTVFSSNLLWCQGK